MSNALIHYFEQFKKEREQETLTPTSSTHIFKLNELIQFIYLNDSFH